MVPVLHKADHTINDTTPYPQSLRPEQVEDINNPRYLDEQKSKETVGKQHQRSSSGHVFMNMNKESTDTHARKDRTSSSTFNHGIPEASHRYDASSSDDNQSQDDDHGLVDFSFIHRNSNDRKSVGMGKRRKTTSKQSSPPRRQPKLHMYASSDSDDSDNHSTGSHRSFMDRAKRINGKATEDSKKSPESGRDHSNSPTSQKRRPGRPRKDLSRSSISKASPGADNSDSDDFMPNRRRRERQTTSDSTASRSKHGGIDPNRTDKAGRTRLFSCTGTGNIERVKELIAMGASVNWRDNAGWTPLHEAALKGQAEVAKHLLECGAEVNAYGFGNDTPLHDACSNGFSECVQILVDHGANINAKNNEGLTPVDVCEDDECSEILSRKQKDLDRISARDKAGRTSLHRACSAGHYEEALSLMKQGSDVNTKDNASWTPLHEAALNGYLDIVKSLVDNGAQLNPLGCDGSTPLHEASENGHAHVVRYLLEASADRNIRNKKGQTAAQVCDDKSIEDLFSADIKPRQSSPIETTAKRASNSHNNTTTSRNKSSSSSKPLSREEKKIQALMETFQKMEKRQARKAKKRQIRHHDDEDDEEDEEDEEEDESAAAASKEPEHRPKRLVRGRPRSVSVSQSREPSEEASTKKPAVKLDPKRKDTAGRTQLHKWAVRGDENAVRELLEAGANSNEKDNAGWTPLHEAALRGRLEVLKLLLQHGADPNALGADKDTPLHDAVENGHTDVVRVLLENGADANARNASNLDCIQIAKDNEDDDMLALLKSVQKRNVAKASSAAAKVEPSSDQDVAQLTVSKAAEVPIKKISENSDDLDQYSYGKSIKKRRLVSAGEYRSRSQSQERKRSEDTSEKPHAFSKVKIERKLPQALAGGFDIFNVSPTPHRKTLSNSKYTPVSGSHSRNVPETEVKKIKQEPEDTPVPSTKKEAWPSLSHALQYLPLYTVHLQETKPFHERAFYVADVQVRLLLGIKNLFEQYPHLEKRIVNEREKERLWSPLAFMVSERCAQAVKPAGIARKEDLDVKMEKNYSSADIVRTKEQEKQRFLQTELFFVRLDQIISIIKKDYSHLSNNLITITLDIGYSPSSDAPPQEKPLHAAKVSIAQTEEEPPTTPLPIKRPAYGLPAKFAMKMQKCGGLGHRRDVSK
ncbi:hypothetical protein NQZ79_g332 [Umbelopsis isabellina]|nr:hypothetical protein NQZ79_g332 [Umbelopsis isabellina]